MTVQGWQYETDRREQAYDVLCLWGQSQTKDGSALDPDVDIVDSRVKQWLQFNGIGGKSSIFAGDEPLQHPLVWPSQIGFTVAFAREYYVPNVLATGRKLLIVPDGTNGTGFDDEHWNVGGDLYEAAVARAIGALSTHPDNTFVGWLWAQGEEEALAGGWTEESYGVAFDAMQANARSRIPGGATAPWVSLRLNPTWVGAVEDRLAIQASIDDLPNRDAYSAVADTAGQASSDGLHFTASAMRSIGAGTVATAYASLL